jgi:hypothetical protein
VVSKQPNPMTLRVPEEWKPELKQAAEKRKLSIHAYILKAVRRCLDGEKPEESTAVKTRFKGEKS